MGVQQTVKAECRDCGGTGVYQGFAEKRGEAVVCLHCGGQGCKELTFTLFTGRNERKGVQVVRRSRGTFLGTGLGPEGNSVTYDEFRRGKMP